MIAVIDASAAVKLVLDEDDTDTAQRVWDETERFLAPTILLPEVAAAISAARRDRRIDEAASARAHALWKVLADFIDQRTVDHDLGARARELAELHPIRGMDAVYLTVAQEIGDAASPPALFSFDTRQRAAAATIGVGIMPVALLDETTNTVPHHAPSDP